MLVVRNAELGWRRNSAADEIAGSKFRHGEHALAEVRRGPKDRLLVEFDPGLGLDIGGEVAAQGLADGDDGQRRVSSFRQ